MPEQMYRVLVECLEAVERGLPGHSASICARHPEYKAEIEDFLAVFEWIARLTAGLRYTGEEMRPSRVEPARR